MNYFLVKRVDPPADVGTGRTVRATSNLMMVIGPALIAMLSGCSTLSGKDKPLDINENMPDVSLVIAAVQDAIDKTADNAAWKESSDYRKAMSLCKSQISENQNNYVEECTPAYQEARAKCKRETGATANVLCADYLREAADTCGQKPEAPDVCAAAKQLKPPHIKLAKLDFVAGYNTNLGGGVSLKLISAKAAAEHGLEGTYSIELVPAPLVKRFTTTRSGEQPVTLTPVVQNLAQALTVALNAAVNRNCGTTIPGRSTVLNCEQLDARQLTLKSASYKFSIDYTTSNGVEFGWSISSLKLVDGTFSAGSKRTTGNVLTVEVER